MNTQILNAKLFEENKANIIFLKAIKNAHQCADKNGNFLHFKALMYPLEYIVTTEQINEAKTLFNAAKKAFLSEIGNKLIFVGMGSYYAPRFEDDVCNYRIRTEILNPEGRQFFIEFGRGLGENLNFDHVIDRDQQKEYEDKSTEIYNKIKSSGFQFHSHPLIEEYKKYDSQPYHWYKRELWSKTSSIKYTKQNVLKWVNDLFNCNFTAMQVDSIFLSPDDYKSISPKTK